MTTFHKNPAPAIFGFATLFLMCSSLWSSQTENIGTTQETTASAPLVCNDFNKMWFGDDNNVRLLHFAADGKRYSMACYIPTGPTLEEINALDFRRRPFFEIDTEATHACRQIAQKENPFVHETWDPFTLNVFQTFVDRAGRMMQWRPINQDDFFKAIAQQPDPGLFLLAKDKGIIYGESVFNKCVLM